jgi:hypothetical protein
VNIPYDEVQFEFEFAVDVSAGVLLGVVQGEPADDFLVAGNGIEPNDDSSL